MRTNLTQPALAKILKTLEARKLIKVRPPMHPIVFAGHSVNAPALHRHHTRSDFSSLPADMPAGISASMSAIVAAVVIPAACWQSTAALPPQHSGASCPAGVIRRIEAFCPSAPAGDYLWWTL